MALDLVCDEDQGDQWSTRKMSVSEWKLLQGAVEVLELVMIVTKVWEVEVRPTMNMVLGELYDLNAKLTEFVNKPERCR